MAEAGAPRIVTSSSAAVYGSAAGALTELDLPRPQNPYGTTKWVAERLLAEVGAATGTASVALRFFNVVGAATPVLADTRTTALLPRVLDAVHGRMLTVHGLAHPLRTAARSATSCTRATWPRRTWPPSAGSRAAGRARRSTTSAPGAGARCSSSSISSSG